MAFTMNQIGRLTSYGYIWMNTGDWTGVTKSLTTSYAELTSLGTNFTLASPSQDFAMTTDGRLKYTGIKTKLFLVDAIAEVDISSFIKIYKNGSALNDSENYAVSFCRVPNYLIELATNDYLSIFAKTTSSTNVNFCQISLSATSTDRRT